ncbi:AP2-like ethylene-responsive transcription factor AIL6 [Striga hermonthica]|uniref:AP2-like ethylene-responsive transcription factor AIL6 n=1 Tax=Striga hermonthica TaxID=68872 RepID=A0A9N7NBU5_STRHE|nr:AP2-like ethylene-responsive transcription factor AIL6 [Striga hermonthica]
MAGRESSNWLSFSLSSMEMLNSSSSSSSSSASTQQPVDSHHYYSFSDSFYTAAVGWPSQKAQPMYPQPQNHEMKSAYGMQPPPKLEDFFAAAATAGDSTETQDSSLTHMYDHRHQAPAAAYFLGGEPQQDLKAVVGFPTFSANSGSEVDDSAFGGQNRSPVDSAADLVAYSQCLTATANGLSLGNNNISNNIYDNRQAIVVAESESCKKTGDSFGQRTSIYRGVTRHRWTGRYEAHLWDNSCRREGQARKGRQGGYDKEEKAARAYDLAALKYWGPSATTNFPVADYAKEMEEMKDATRQEFIASLRRKSSGFSRGASIYRGVTRHHQQGRWQARIGRVAGNKDLYLGTFATEEEAAEAYDIAAIKFRGTNAVTNFEMSRYDVEAIANSPLPVGGSAKRLKLSLEGDQKNISPPPGASLEVASPGIQPLPPSAVPLDGSSAPYYHHSFLHHLYSQTAAASSAGVGAPASFVPLPGEFFIWPHQSY